MEGEGQRVAGLQAYPWAAALSVPFPWAGLGVKLQTSFVGSLMVLEPRQIPTFLYPEDHFGSLGHVLTLFLLSSWDGDPRRGH